MRGHTSLSVGLLLTVFGCGLLFGQPARCTQDAVVGTYAIATEGTMLVTPPGASQPVLVPTASLSLVWIDRQGMMSGQGFASLGGTVSQVPGAGSIQVNPDCTGAIRTAVGTTSVDVILDEGKEIWGVMVQAPGAKPVAHGIARRVPDCRRHGATGISGLAAQPRTCTAPTPSPTREPICCPSRARRNRRRSRP
jgi:hypothetical protein